MKASSPLLTSGRRHRTEVELQPKKRTLSTEAQSPFFLTRRHVFYSYKTIYFASNYIHVVHTGESKLKCPATSVKGLKSS
jgi:hypothetical protein